MKKAFVMCLCLAAVCAFGLGVWTIYIAFPGEWQTGKTCMFLGAAENETAEDPADWTGLYYEYYERAEHAGQNSWFRHLQTELMRLIDSVRDLFRTVCFRIRLCFEDAQ